MERWVPLFNIFLNSPCPEGEASRWFHQQRYDQHFSHQQQHPKPAHSRHPAAAFLSLLVSPADVVAGPVGDLTSLGASPTTTRRCLWIQTLPCAVQSRILSFLTVDRWRFPDPLLRALATMVLLDTNDGSNCNGSSKPLLETFWVVQAARNLLDALSSENACPELAAPSICVGNGNEEEDIDEFYSLPPWLERAATPASARPMFPWLPMSRRQVSRANRMATHLSSHTEAAEDSLATEAEGSARHEDDPMEKVAATTSALKITTEEQQQEHQRLVPTPDVLARAAELRAEILSTDSVSAALRVAMDVKKLCLGPGEITPAAADYALHILSLIEPWQAEDETAGVLLSTMLNSSSSSSSSDVGGDDHWPGRLFSAILLPKLIALEQPASRALLSSILDFTKAHPRSISAAVLFPLLYRRGGINPPLCDVLVRVMKESLHTPQVSAFCHRLLCSKRCDGDFFLLPCHRDNVIFYRLEWTESLFSLFQNFLAWGAQLTPETIDKLVMAAEGSASELTKSLKFGNFLLSLATKSEWALEVHKAALLIVAARTQTFVTKSVISKLETSI